MKEFNFYGSSNDRNIDLEKYKNDQEKEKIYDEIYWYILDHDHLHKKYFLPLAHELSNCKTDQDFNIKQFSIKFMPMVNRGCIDYYKEQKMIDDPNEIFPREIRKKLCYKLATQLCDDLEKKEYTINEMMAPPSGPEIPSSGHLSLESDNPDGKTVVDFKLEKHHGPEKWAELQADMKEFKPLKSISERKKSIKQRLDPKCWKGYRKAGTKIKGGVRVNKCVKVSEGWEVEMQKLIKLLENK